MENDHLNVLFVMTDQHQAACTGYEGHAQAITPNMDRLAHGGVRFRHAYTANPICTPTRVSILTGQYVHNHGYFGLGGPTPANLPTFLGHFRRHGYRTAIIGKTHLPNKPEPWAKDDCDLFLPLPFDDDYAAELEAAGFPNEFDCNRFPELNTGNDASDARPSKLPFELSVEGYQVRRSIEFMRESAHADKPFCMEVSLNRPHQVYTPAQQFWDTYDDDLDLPPGALEDLNPDRPPHFLTTAGWSRTLEARFEPSDHLSRMKRVWKGYLACVTHCDHALGQLLNYLDESGLAERTIVVYSSDHGAYSGTFGINEKAPGICSEQVCRIPYLWRVPGVTKVDHESLQLAHIVDLAPTVTTLCGLPALDFADGKDLTALLRGEDSPVRDTAVTEHVWSKAVRWDRWRYVHYQEAMFEGEDIGELYDINADPLETRNLYHDPQHQHIVHESRRRLLDWLIQTTRYVTAHPEAERYRAEDGPATVGGDGKEASQYSPLTRAAAGSRNYI